MANYTSTTLKFTEAIGDSVIGLNMISSGTITISPKSGYVVAASDFSVPNLPNNITSVTFADVTTAGLPGNTVIATVTLGSLFTVSAGKTVNLSIVGDAKIYNPETQTINFSIKLIDQQSDNPNGASSVSSVSGSTVTTVGSVTDPIRTYTVSGSTTTNTLTKLGTLTITNDPGGYS